MNIHNLQLSIYTCYGQAYKKNKMTENNHNCRDIDKTSSDIEKYGLSVIMIQSTDYLPSFGYSIGLWEKFNHPEIICFGLKVQTIHEVINEIADLIKNGERIETNRDYDNIFTNICAQFISVDDNNLSDYFGTAIDFYEGKHFPALQLVWTDRNNKFPWDENFEEEFEYKQPLLDRNTNFKFREARNLGVFTTNDWIEENNPILYVVHDSDGDWQFLTGGIIEEQAKIVSIEEIIKRDTTLNDVFDLDYGEEAEREFVGGKWSRRKIEYDDEENA